MHLVQRLQSGRSKGICRELKHRSRNARLLKHDSKAEVVAVRCSMNPLSISSKAPKFSPPCGPASTSARASNRRCAASAHWRGGGVLEKSQACEPAQIPKSFHKPKRLPSGLESRREGPLSRSRLEASSAAMAAISRAEEHRSRS